MPVWVDATGVEVSLPVAPRRIVSLIPSITEILFALGVGQAVAGCTIYCTEPADGVATKTRIGGEKNPKLELIRELAPDLVVANVEENLREHVEQLRDWSIAVFVTYPRTVADGIRLVRQLGEMTGVGATAQALADDLERRLLAVARQREGKSPAGVFYPIWRNPYMTVNRDTYAHDMLAICGGVNVFGDEVKRYPEVSLAQVAAARPDVILLPDEPYRFRRAHVPDFAPYREMPAVRDGRLHLVDGKLATWYGPRIAEALRVLPGLLSSEPRVA
jgi:ABC-type Fe3+-hydroxamate transport system substrate-binding protein